MSTTSLRLWLLRLGVTVATLAALLASLVIVPARGQARGGQSTRLTQRPPATRQQAQTPAGTISAAASLASASVQGTGNLLYRGGPVQHTPVVYLTFWGPNWVGADAGTAQIIQSFFQDVGGTAYENTLTQYYDTLGGNIHNVLTLGGTLFDTATSSVTSTTCGGPTLTDTSDIQKELVNARTAAGWPFDQSNATYFIFTPPGYTTLGTAVVGCVGPNKPTNQNELVCGYHSYTTVAYAVVPYDDFSGCDVTESPNGNLAADAIAAAAAHEAFEAITDPQPASGIAWNDSSSDEVADKCNRDFGAGLSYLHNGGVFLLQTQYSNAQQSCVKGAPPAGTVFRGKPTTVDYFGTAVVFVRGSDGVIYQNFYNGSAWNPWFYLGGFFAGNPVAIMYNNDLYVFVVGRDGALYDMYWDGSNWHGWYSLGGTVVGNPSVVIFNQALQIFVRGTDNTLYQKFGYGPTSWTGWMSLGGGLTSDPAPIDYGGILNVFARGTNDALWDQYYDNGWSGWISLGGGLTSTAAPINYNGALHVFARGADQGLWDQYYWNGWSGWYSLGGILTSDPVAFNYSSFLGILTLGTDDAVWLQHWDGTRWVGWSSLGIPVSW